MATLRIDITNPGAGRRNPFFAVNQINNGDTLIFATGSDASTELVFDSDTIGRLDPQPNAVLPLPAGNEVTFTVSDAAPGTYVVKLKRPGESTPQGGASPLENPTSAVLVIFGLGPKPVPSGPVLEGEGNP